MKPPKKTKAVERNIIFLLPHLVLGAFQKADWKNVLCSCPLRRATCRYVPVSGFKSEEGFFPIPWFENFKAVDQAIQIGSLETASDEVIEEDIVDKPGESLSFE